MSAGDDDSPDDSRQAIFIESGKAPELADQALAAALEHGAPVWKSGGQLVTIAEDTTTTADRVKRPRGAPRRLPLTSISLAEILTRHVRFFKWDARTSDFKPIDCPARLAAALVERGSWPGVPELHGFVGGPTLRADGVPVTASGYDADSGLYVVDWEIGDVALPGSGVGTDMLRTLAQAAGSRLEDAIDTLPFVEDEDRTAMLAAIMTAICVRSIEAAPGAVFTAPGAGTGKTMAADLVSTVATP